MLSVTGRYKSWPSFYFIASAQNFRIGASPTFKFLELSEERLIGQENISTQMKTSVDVSVSMTPNKQTILKLF